MAKASTRWTSTSGSRPSGPSPSGRARTARARAVAASEKRTGVPGRQTAVGGPKTRPRQYVPTCSPSKFRRWHASQPARAAFYDSVWLSIFIAARSKATGSGFACITCAGISKKHACRPRPEPNDPPPNFDPFPTQSILPSSSFWTRKLKWPQSGIDDTVTHQPTKPCREYTVSLSLLSHVRGPPPFNSSCMVTARSASPSPTPDARA